MTESEWWDLKSELVAVLRDGDYIEACTEAGVDASGAVEVACDDPAVRTILDRFDGNNTWLMLELCETGAWEASELQDHETNLQRFVWILAGETQDNDDRSA